MTRSRCPRKSLRASSDVPSRAHDAGCFLRDLSLCLCGSVRRLSLRAPEQRRVWLPVRRRSAGRRRHPAGAPRRSIGSAMSTTRRVRKPPESSVALPPPQAVPALLQAVQEHADGYVRFKALVLLTGFNDPRAADQMVEALAAPNDRLREVAYGYFERFPKRSLIPRLLAALDKELGEFVRPALVRALAAVGDDPKVRDVLLVDVMRGADSFPQHRDRGARRSSSQLRHRQALRGGASTKGRCRTTRCSRWGRSATSGALEVFAALQRSGQAGVATDCGGGDLPARHQLRIASRLSAEGAWVRRRQSRLSGAGPRGRRGLDAVAAKGNAEALKILFDSRDPRRGSAARAVGAREWRRSRCATRRSCCRCSPSSTDQPGAIAYWPKGSICCRKTSRRSSSSSRCAASIGRRPDAVADAATSPNN